MEPKINYVALLILIILGVAIGNLASSLITTKYLDEEQEKEAIETSKAKPGTPSMSTSTDSKKPEITLEIVKLSPEVHQEPQIEPEATENPVDHERLIEQRRLNENGLRLSKKCNEWTTVHKDMNTPSSERGMNKHCAEYYDYLSFGNLPNSN
jgi:hypothetical protein